MEKIKVGVIGTGMAWEKLHWPAFQELADRFEIRAVCDVNRERAETWGRKLGLPPEDIFTDYHALLGRADLQAVDIIVPIALNHRVAAAAVRAGKAVILEKPMGATYQEALATRDLSAAYGIPLLVAENYRYSEEFNLIRDLIRTEKIGRPVFFIYHTTSCFPCAMKEDTFAAKEWRQHPVYPGGDILDAAIHPLAGIRHVFGGIKYLQAFGVPQDDGFSPYAVITVNIHFMNNVIGTFSYYNAGQEPQKPLVGLRIFGEKGQLYLEDPNCGYINLFYNDGGHELIPYRPMRGYYNELLNFHKALTGEEALAVTPDMELGDMRTVFAILQSIRDQDVVKVDRVPEYTLA